MVQHLRVSAPWLKRYGKCKTVTVTRADDPFFGIEDEVDSGDLDPATRFCNGTDDGVVCPIREQCGIFALTNNEKTGVWGGMAPATRKAIRRQWPLRRGKIPRPEWHFMTEAEALAMLSDDDRAELQAEIDAEGTEWAE